MYFSAFRGVRQGIVQKYGKYLYDPLPVTAAVREQFFRNLDRQADGFFGSQRLIVFKYM